MSKHCRIGEARIQSLRSEIRPALRKNTCILHHVNSWPHASQNVKDTTVASGSEVTYYLMLPTAMIGHNVVAMCAQG
jgi:hypothetical protein